MTALDFLGGLATVPGITHPTLFLEVYLTALLSYVRREPVRAAALLVAVGVLIASVALGVPVSVVVAQVVSYVAVLEKVRDKVTPVVQAAEDVAHALGASGPPAS